MSDLHWVLIVFDPTSDQFDWAYTSNDRQLVSMKRMDMHDLGYSMSGMFIHRFDYKPSILEISNLVVALNRFEAIITRYLS